MHSLGLEGAIGSAVVIGKTIENDVGPCGTGTIGDRHLRSWWRQSVACWVERVVIDTHRLRVPGRLGSGS